MGAIVFFRKRNTTEVVRLITVFNIIIGTSVELDILSTPNNTGTCKKKNNKAETMNGWNMFFDSSESRLKTNPVERICSVTAAMKVDAIHISDSVEMCKEGNAIPFVIRVRTATPINKDPIPKPNNTSPITLFFLNPTPVKKDSFSDFTIYQ